MRLSYAVLLAAAVGCNSSSIDIRYHLQGLTPSSVVRVDTLVNVDPADPRMFYANQPYREVATGVGFSVTDLDGSGKLTMMIEFDSTIGYQFKKDFDFNLLPPVGESAPRLILTSRAMGTVDAISNTVMTHAQFGHGPVDVTLTDARCGSTGTCPANQSCCNTSCIETASDVKNCGGCGMSCGVRGDACSGGQCRCGGGSECTSGQTCCSGIGCIDLMTDPFHCGACGKACNPGESCVAGACKCGTAAACTGTNPVCCVSAAGASCSGNGTCVCGASVCTAPSICCGTTCHDLKSDNADCGTCGNACTSPLTCSGGACTCAGQICSTGDTCCTNGCANLQTDPANCGTCGHACATGETCVGGSCMCGTSSCSATQSCCGTTCVTTTNDFNNCGACGHSCKQGETCSGSACHCNGGAACVGNQTCCPSGTSGGGGCFDLSNGPEHCGSCTNGPCQMGQMCSSGMCVASTCSPPCTNGNQCAFGHCVCPGANTDTACTGTQQCCAGTGCVDFQTDPQNCGGCGHGCGGDQQCCGAMCVALTDPNNCGKCGNVCTSPTGSGTPICCNCAPSYICETSKCFCPVPPA